MCKSVKGILFTLVFAAWGCGKEPVNLVSDQRDAFVSHLASTDYTEREGVFVVIPNADRDGRENQPVIQSEGTVSFDFAAFRFRRSGTQDSIPAFTNRTDWVPRTMLTPGWAGEIVQMGSPKSVTLGSASLIAGVERGLPGCRVGDSVRLFITSDLAFGTTAVGTIDANTPLIYVLKIISQ